MSPQLLIFIAVVWCAGLTVGLVKLARHYRPWLREGIVVRRWQYIIAAFVVGVGIAVGILASAKALRDLNHEREVRGRQLQAEVTKRLEAELLTKADVTSIAERVVRLERPTNLEQVRRLTRALKILFANRKFQRQFGIRTITLSNPPPTITITRPKPSTKKPTPTTKKPSTKKPSKPPSSGGQVTTSPPPPAPQGNPPIVSITPPTPLPFHVCTGLIDVGCPHP